MKRILIAVFILGGPQVFGGAWTAEPPLRAKVISFDKKCVELQTADGKKLKVQRETLGGTKLVSGETEIKYFEASLRSHLCH